MNELSKLQEVTFTPAVIRFDIYDELLTLANQVADYIQTVEVNPETVKAAKKELAAARKVTKGLHDKRIEIKKGILAGYTDFENKIHTICAVIDSADDALSAKVHDLEEAERSEKKAAIREIWDKRIWQYRIGILIPNAFDRWLTPQHLNKTMSMNQVEKDMVDWLEDTEKSLEALDQMDDEYTVEYIGCLDLPEAIATVNARTERKQAVMSNKTEETATFTVTGKANIRLVEMLLKENEITYMKG